MMISDRQTINILKDEIKILTEQLYNAYNRIRELIDEQNTSNDNGISKKTPK
jgi:hypothetical protein